MAGHSEELRGDDHADGREHRADPGAAEGAGDRREDAGVFHQRQRAEPAVHQLLRQQRPVARREARDVRRWSARADGGPLAGQGAGGERGGRGRGGFLFFGGGGGVFGGGTGRGRGPRRGFGPARAGRREGGAGRGSG